MKTLDIIWKKIEGFDNYSISNTGLVRNDKTGKLRCINISNGYYNIMLFINSKRKKFRLHRLLYNTFICKIPDGLFINHKNEIKTDNRLENLEVCDNRYNISYSIKETKTNERNITLTKNNKYRIHIYLNGKQNTFGSFNNLEDAIKKRNEIYKQYNIETLKTNLK
jgi:hypothetical protein